MYPSNNTSINSNLELPFAKLHGAGNAYTVVNGIGLSLDWQQLAKQISDPIYGTGSDGLLVADHSKTADVQMRVFNPDGSEAEMSGNGIRIFTKFVLDNEIVTYTKESLLRVETLAGERQVQPYFKDGVVMRARVSMGSPNFSHSAVGIVGQSGQQDTQPISLTVLEQQLELICLSLGNPHAVAIIEEPVANFPLREIGTQIENHKTFTNRINFEIVNVIGYNTLRIRIFERGAGETLSSGTGSTAAAVASITAGHCNARDSVKVITDGGELTVEVTPTHEAFLSGPVALLFNGVWPIS